MTVVFGGTNRFLGKKRLLLVLGLLLLLAAVFCLSYYAPSFSSFGLWGAAGALLALMVAIKAVGVIERKNARLGGGIYGEAVVSRELRRLPDGYAVFRGLLVNEHQDIDCAVIGPNGVFAVEVKSHKGTIGFDGEQLTRNGRRFEKDFFRETMSEAVGLRALLARAAKLDIFVEPVIVFSSTAAAVRLGPDKIKNCYVIGKDRLNELIMGASSCRIDAASALAIIRALAESVNDRRKEKKLARLEKFLNQHVYEK